MKKSLSRITDANKNVKEKFVGKLKYAAWCQNCGGDWYAGRIAAVEVFDVNDDIKTMILKWKSTLDIYGEARDYGYLTMKEDAYLKVLKWHTTLEEVRRLF
jgi:type II secretory ATPase GspE/PulE/Tfp pilus assembly ATPase PilB-like protein